MAKPKKNPRQVAIEKIATKVALFLATESYANDNEDEEDGRKKLIQICDLLTEAGKLFAKSDERANAAGV